MDKAIKSLRYLISLYNVNILTPEHFAVLIEHYVKELNTLDAVTVLAYLRKEKFITNKEFSILPDYIVQKNLVRKCG